MAVTDAQLAARYQRLYVQLHTLFTDGAKRTDDPLARMATLCALLLREVRPPRRGPLAWFNQTPFKASPTLPGVTDRGKPPTNIRRLSFQPTFVTPN